MAVKAEEEAWKGRDAHGLETYSQNRTATRLGNGPDLEMVPKERRVQGQLGWLRHLAACGCYTSRWGPPERNGSETKNSILIVFGLKYP